MKSLHLYITVVNVLQIFKQKDTTMTISEEKISALIEYLFNFVEEKKQSVVAFDTDIIGAGFYGLFFSFDFGHLIIGALKEPLEGCDYADHFISFLDKEGRIICGHSCGSFERPMTHGVDFLTSGVYKGFLAKLVGFIFNGNMKDNTNIAKLHGDFIHGGAKSRDLFFCQFSLRMSLLLNKELSPKSFYNKMIVVYGAKGREGYFAMDVKDGSGEMVTTYENRKHGFVIKVKGNNTIVEQKPLSKNV